MEAGHTQSIVIFGAGEAGRRALSICAATVGRDTGLRRQQSRSPGHIVRRTACHRPFVIAGAQSRPRGHCQPGGGGHHSAASPAWCSRARLQVYNQVATLCGGAPFTGGGARILVLTDDCIAPSHGTGAVLLRHFAGYPRELLLHAYLRLKGDPFLPYSYKIAPAGDCASLPPEAGRLERPAMTASQLVAELQWLTATSIWSIRLLR